MTTEGKRLLPGFTTREHEWRGRALRYAVAGEGESVVLVHGLGGTIANWCGLAPALAETHRVVVPDLPGHGGSAALQAATHIDPFADAMLAVLEAEHALPAVWVGHSLGGLVALRVAVRHPDAVRGVVLAGAAGIAPSARFADVTLAAWTHAGRLVAPLRGRLASSRLGRTAAFGGWGVADPAALDPAQAEAFLSGPAEHTDMAAAGRALLASDPRADLERVACPVLCLWGTSDNWVPLADGMEYARRLRAPLRTIAGCGHLLIGERPDACLAAIGEFLDAL